jgi:cytochrome c peroxidase
MRFALALCLGLLVACGDGVGPPELTPQAAIDVQLRAQLERWGVLSIKPLPAEDPALVALGQALTFDKILSGNRDISCATCHQPSLHGGDGLSLAVGTGAAGAGLSRTPGPGRPFVPRNSPTLLNQGLRPQYLFWDGRISGHGSGPFQTPPEVDLPPGLPNLLAAQAMLPVLNRVEMRGLPGDRDVFGNPNELAAIPDSQYVAVWDEIMDRLRAIPEYMAMFAAAFPGKVPQGLGFEYAATAIAAYVTSAFSRYDSPFDRYLARHDAALTPDAKRGALLFFERLPCGQCHNGPLVGGERFANVGVPQLGPGVGSAAPLDLGRAEVELSRLPQPLPPKMPIAYRFAFRAPPLRNVELTSPYMHNGAYPTLEDVVRHYDDVPFALRNYDVTQLAPTIRRMVHNDAATINDVTSTLEQRLRTPLRLTEEERRELVAFLRSLTDPAARELSALVPARVPSGLPMH